MKRAKAKFEPEPAPKRGWALTRSGTLSYGTIAANEIEIPEKQAKVFLLQQRAIRIFKKLTKKEQMDRKISAA